MKNCGIILLVAGLLSSQLFATEQRAPVAQESVRKERCVEQPKRTPNVQRRIVFNPPTKKICRTIKLAAANQRR